ncbi:hypothetical protein ABFS83_02G044300 [Erythranthe nasuta]
MAKSFASFLAVIICFALVSGCLGQHRRHICSFDLHGQHCISGDPDSCTSICKSTGVGGFDFLDGICYTDLYDKTNTYCTCSVYC